MFKAIDLNDDHVLVMAEVQFVLPDLADRLGCILGLGLWEPSG
jgi:hypothetical protein